MSSAAVHGCGRRRALAGPLGADGARGGAVALINPPGGAPVASTVTDACGRFQFTGAPAGPYLLCYGGRNFSGTMPFNAGGPMLFIACNGFNPPYVNEAVPHLRRFVGMGGSLYATHNAVPYIGAAFPESLDYDVDNQGGAEVRRANVIDPGLAVALGGLMQVDLVYDTGGWGLLNNDQPFTTLPFLRDTDTQKPMAMRFMYGIGSVRFSSFHKEPQMSATQEAIIIYMISGM